MSYASTQLWLRSVRQDIRLKETYETAHRHSTQLLAEISRFLPHYTVHDIGHVEALWQCADRLVPHDFPLTPIEGFVLGCSFLVHDAAMSLPALGGIEGLKKNPALWEATVRDAFTELGFAHPDAGLLANPPDKVRDMAVEILLRDLHAENAIDLATRAWDFEGESVHLIEDPGLRKDYGHLIGLIAASHGRSLDAMVAQFQSFRAPAASGASHDADVDAIKLACVLRTADAMNVDSSRAPLLFAALRNPTGESRLHAVFQSLLNPAIVDESKRTLIYSSRKPFGRDHIDAWWLAYDTLGTLHRELAAVDALLRDTGRPRLAAAAVEGADSPERFAERVQLEGVRPIDASIRISNIPRVIERLGGTQLYGDDLRVPIRELLQNASDASLARRAIEGVNAQPAQIIVSISPAEEGTWELSVADAGIGMDEEIIRRYLLDFGVSYWRSRRSVREFPQIRASGADLTGKFGIGFYSIFMLGRDVRVVSRRFNQPHAPWLGVRFRHGLKLRPIISAAADDSLLLGNQTQISVVLDASTVQKLVHLSEASTPPEAVETLVRSLAIAMPVHVAVQTPDNTLSVCEGDDWKTISSEALLGRIRPTTRFQRSDSPSRWFLDLLQPLYFAGPDGARSQDQAGRFALFPAGHIFAEYIYSSQPFGWVMVGPFPTHPLQKFAGVLHGETSVAARNKVFVDVSKLAWREWINDQCERLSDGLSAHHSREHQSWTAMDLLELGARPWRLSLFSTGRTWLTANQLPAWLEGRKSFSLAPAAWSRDPARSRNTLLYPSSHRLGTDLAVFTNLQPIKIETFVAEICKRCWGRGRFSVKSGSVNGTWIFSRSD